MVAVLGGLGAALIWSVGIAFAARVTRDIGSGPTLAWVMPIGLIVLVPILLASGPVHLTASAVLWLVLGGVGNVAGLLILYHALRIGQMGVVVPIVTTEGGITAVIAVLGGERITIVGAAALAVTVAGVVMTAIGRRAPVAVTPVQPPPPAEIPRSTAVATPHGANDRRAAVWATATALSFGVSLFATGRAGSLVPTAWAVLPPRLIGVAVITIPLALRGGLGRPAANARPLLVSGVCEVAGFFAYATGARHGIAVAAVMATLGGAISVGFGRVLFGERLVATQVAGVIVIIAGVATLTAISASP